MQVPTSLYKNIKDKPLIEDQNYALISFKPSKNASPDQNGRHMEY